jgi:hypothetical protein
LTTVSRPNLLAESTWQRTYSIHLYAVCTLSGRFSYRTLKCKSTDRKLQKFHGGTKRFTIYLKVVR